MPTDRNLSLSPNRRQLDALHTGTGISMPRLHVSMGVGMGMGIGTGIGRDAHLLKLTTHQSHKWNLSLQSVAKVAVWRLELVRLVHVPYDDVIRVLNARQHTCDAASCPLGGL